MPSKNDEAWEKVIQEKKIRLDGSLYRLSAKELKEITDREPRLLSKFDTPGQLPMVLRQSDYAILPVANGEYIIFRGNVFCRVPPCQEKEVFAGEPMFPLLTSARGTGESDYLDIAFNYGLLSEFAKSGFIYQTIRGRERTVRFQFRIKSAGLGIGVEGVQIEVDGGYEGRDDILLIEAKIGKPSHFNIRQLYYPFRHFSALVPSKKIRTILLLYDVSSAIYSLYEYGFNSEDTFDSIVLLRGYSFELGCLRHFGVDDLIDSDFITEAPLAPQADDLNKIVELLALINSGDNSADAIADYFSFDQRQSYYYGEAAEYLGLLKDENGKFELTTHGSRLIRAHSIEQLRMLAKLVVNSWIFRELLSRAAKRGYFTLEDIEEIIRSVRARDGSKRYSGTTISRRRQTIVSWARWLAGQFQILREENGKFALL